MRPVALSDESLETMDEEEFEHFERNGLAYGRRSKREEPKTLLDMFDDPDEEVEEDIPELDFEEDDV